MQGACGRAWRGAWALQAANINLISNEYVGGCRQLGGIEELDLLLHRITRRFLFHDSERIQKPFGGQLKEIEHRLIFISFISSNLKDSMCFWVHRGHMSIL